MSTTEGSGRMDGSRPPVVLVVDDEALVRMGAVDLFEDLGFEVLEACDGWEALSLLERRPDIALLFSDCRMPGMTGPELAEVASKRYPRLKIILASGYIRQAPTGWPFISKPYDARTIEPLVRPAA